MFRLYNLETGILDYLKFVRHLYSSQKASGSFWRVGVELREREKCIIESRIEFPDPMFMTFDTPHGLNTKFSKKYAISPLLNF